MAHDQESKQLITNFDFLLLLNFTWFISFIWITDKDTGEFFFEISIPLVFYVRYKRVTPPDLIDSAIRMHCFANRDYDNVWCHHYDIKDWLLGDVEEHEEALDDAKPVFMVTRDGQHVTLVKTLTYTKRPRSFFRHNVATYWVVYGWRNSRDIELNLRLNHPIQLQEQIDKVERLLDDLHRDLTEEIDEQ